AEHEGIQQAELVEGVLGALGYTIQRAAGSATETVVAVLGVQGVVVDVLEAGEEPIVTPGHAELAQVGQRRAVDVPGIVEDVPVAAGAEGRMRGATGAHRGRDSDGAVEIAIQLRVLEVEPEGTCGGRGQRQSPQAYGPAQQIATQPAPLGKITASRVGLDGNIVILHCYTPDYYGLWIRYANATQRRPGCQVIDL